MRSLFLDRFGPEAQLVNPFDEIAEGVKLGFDGNILSRLGTVSVRTSETTNVLGEMAEYLIVDINNFSTSDWFTLEVNWPDEVVSLETRLRLYPCTHLQQRVYFSHGSDGNQYVDLLPESVSDSFTSLLHYKEDLYQSNGVPRDANNLRLNLMVPMSEWVSIGIMSLQDR